MQRGSPAHQRAVLWLSPEPGDQRPQEELLRQAHARIGRHFERAELDQTKPAGWTIRRIQLVDADLGAVCVAGDVNQQVAEQTIDQPRPRLLAAPGAGTIESAISSS